MARAVFYKGDKLFTFAKRVQDGFDYFDILLFMMTAHVVNFPDPAIFQNKLNCPAMILHIQPVAHVFTISINGQGLILQSV